MNDHIIIGKDSYFSFTLDRSEKIDWQKWKQ
jgi:DNA repair protein RadC